MNHKILLVDDEEGICKVLGLSLKDRGFEVITAADGVIALSLFEKTRPSIVITDIKMPGMDGLDLLQQIKAVEPDTEVIMITGHGDLDLAVKSLKNRACDFITKPINEDVLEVALNRASERISLRRQLREYTENLEKLVYEKSRKLVEAERMGAIGETVAGLSHTIKSIASGLTGGSFVLEQGIHQQDNTLLIQGWDMIRGNVEKITHLSMDMLDYAKLGRLHPEPIHPGLPAKEVYALLSSVAEERGVAFELDIDETATPANMDAEGIQRCLLNLASNALDACTDHKNGNKKPKISLRCRKSETGGVEYLVEDNGSGMDEALLDNIFKAFFTTKGSRGTGIGLMMTKKIVDLHGGKLEVTSIPGAGTKMIIRIPAKTMPASLRTGAMSGARPDPATPE